MADSSPTTMLFHSPIFGIFLAAVLVLYWALRPVAARQSILLVASYLFYAGWDWHYLPLLLVSTAVDFVAAQRIGGSRVTGVRRVWLGASLATNLGLLALFKYGNLALETAQPLLAPLGFEAGRLPTEIPLGISFYTFQTLSYTIDVYRRQAQPCRSPLQLALYVSFFAQLVAGPIVRARDLLPQLAALRDLGASALAQGVQRFLLGLFKKVVIADNVGLFVDAVFAAPEEYSAITLWCAAYGFGLQIYCDFSGYTDMALGLGRMFGLNLPENFRTPYLATSLSEFWRRWHISLSSWLRDYLYIPLGGSRRSVRRVYANLMVTMVLGGLWHGAAWTFVLWGAFHGLLLALERALGQGRAGTAEIGSSPESFVRALVTFHLVTVGWVVFRCENFASLAVTLERMATAWSWTGRGEGIGLAWAAVLAVFIAAESVSGRLGGAGRFQRLPTVVQGFVLALLVLAAAFLHVEENAFIYFQF